MNLTGKFIEIPMIPRIKGTENKGSKTNPVTADGSKNVEVTRVNEVENDSIEGTFAFLETVSDSVFSLL